MDWKQLLVNMTGSVDQELLVRNAYLVTEKRILRQQITGRVRRMVNWGECIENYAGQVNSTFRLSWGSRSKRPANLDPYLDGQSSGKKEGLLRR
jgi:hypothetical protein